MFCFEMHDSPSTMCSLQYQKARVVDRAMNFLRRGHLSACFSILRNTGCSSEPLLGFSRVDLVRLCGFDIVPPGTPHGNASLVSVEVSRVRKCRDGWMRTSLTLQTVVPSSCTRSGQLILTSLSVPKWIVELRPLAVPHAHGIGGAAQEGLASENARPG